MTNAKDTFYLMLRDRLAALNPVRTFGLRGVTRPGILVEENELATDRVIPDIFRLRWTGVSLNTDTPLPLATLTCAIHYETAGSSGSGGMDRGRLLAQMDSELSSALTATPHSVLKRSYAQSGSNTAPIAMGTNIFWGAATFSSATTTSERVARVATVELFAYQEPGE